jgi:hypothetical protein
MDYPMEQPTPHACLTHGEPRNSSRSSQWSRILCPRHARSKVVQALADWILADGLHDPACKSRASGSLAETLGHRNVTSNSIGSQVRRRQGRETARKVARDPGEKSLQALCVAYSGLLDRCGNYRLVKALREGQSRKRKQGICCWITEVLTATPGRTLAIVAARSHGAHLPLGTRC